MRTTLLLLTLSLAAASFAALPSAEAAQEVCTFRTHADCGGYVCAGDGTTWSDNECVSKSDLEIDTCHFQSDCCSTVSFWCPEDS